MRYYLGVILSLAVIAGGLKLMTQGPSGNDGSSTLTIGAALVGFGVLIYIAARRARNNSTGSDPAKVSARAVAMRKLDDFSDDGDGDGGDDGGD